MLNGIKFPHRASTRPAEGQSSTGPGHARPGSSPQAHHDLAGRGSPGAGGGSMAPRGGLFQASERHGHKHSFFSSLFHRHGSSSTSAASASSSPHRADSQAPVDRFNSGLAEFAKHHPDEGLKRQLMTDLATGQVDQFERHASQALRTTQDPKSAELLQSMLRSMKEMAPDDLLNVRISGYRPGR